MSLTETRQEAVNITEKRDPPARTSAAAILRASYRFSPKSVEALRDVWPELSGQLVEARTRELRRRVQSNGQSGAEVA